MTSPPRFEAEWTRQATIDNLRMTLVSAALLYCSEAFREGRRVVIEHDILDQAATAFVDKIRSPETCANCGQDMPPVPAEVNLVAPVPPWATMQWMERGADGDAFHHEVTMPSYPIRIDSAEQREDEGKVYVYFRRT